MAIHPLKEEEEEGDTWVDMDNGDCDGYSLFADSLFLHMCMHGWGLGY